MGGVVAAKSAYLRQQQTRAIVLLEPVLYSPIRALRFRFLTKLNLHRKIPLVEAAARRRARFESFEHAISSYQGRGAFTSWGEEWVRNYVMGGFKKTNEGTDKRINDPSKPENWAATDKSKDMSARFIDTKDYQNYVNEMNIIDRKSKEITN